MLVSTPVTDKAVLTGASSAAGGTVSYAVYSDSGCTDQVASLGSSVAVTNGVPGSSNSWTASAGAYWFEATYTGDTADTGPVSSSCQSFTVDNPSLGIVKTAYIASFSAPGTPVSYSYAVTNTGNVALTNVTVTDPMPGLSAINCGGNSDVVTSLTAGASVTCTATYTTTQADVDTGSISNTGTAIGTPPVGNNVSANDSVTIPAVQSPAIGMTKSASISGFSAAGTPVSYSYVVTNTGNVTLTSVRVPTPWWASRPSTARLHPRPRRHRDLHGHLHHHPGRRGCRLHHQHRHGHRHPAAVRTQRHRHLLGHHPGRTGPGHRDREDG